MQSALSQFNQPMQFTIKSLISFVPFILYLFLSLLSLFFIITVFPLPCFCLLVFYLVKLRSNHHSLQAITLEFSGEDVCTYVWSMAVLSIKNNVSMFSLLSKSQAGQSIHASTNQSEALENLSLAKATETLCLTASLPEKLIIHRIQAVSGPVSLQE